MTDWIEHTTGNQPVDDAVVVQVKLRVPMFPDEEYEDEACVWDWSIENVDGGIVAYRIIES